jgi:threonine dehydratase
VGARRCDTHVVGCHRKDTGRTTRKWLPAGSPVRLWPACHYCGRTPGVARVVDVGVGGVAAGSLETTRISKTALQLARSAGVTTSLVSDEDILSARQLLREEFRIVAEAGGATALAALTSGAYRPEAGER